MKTIKQLEQEIEELICQNDKDNYGSKKTEIFDFRIPLLHATLKQTIAIKKMIVHLIKECDKKITSFELATDSPGRKMVHYSILRQRDVLSEILTKIDGGEE